MKSEEYASESKRPKRAAAGQSFIPPCIRTQTWGSSNTVFNKQGSAEGMRNPDWEVQSVGLRFG